MSLPIKVDDDTLDDIHKISKELDRTKSAVFLDKKNAAFLGSLMCSLNFVWSRSIPTAATNAVYFWWNPEWFMSLDPEVRKTVLMHELWHVARLHMIRAESRNVRVWNYACDIRINNDLEKEGASFHGVEDCWKDQTYDANGIMAEEDIYDLLIQNQMDPQGGSWTAGDDGDMIPLSNQDMQTAVNSVVQAIHQAKLAGQAGNLPGGIEQIIKQFLEPIIPWQTLLMQFFTDMLDEDYSWKRPNRRYSDMYLPSKFTDDGRLEHLIYFLDVSGSITDTDLLRFNSEVKYIQEVLKPQKLTLVQFDTEIQQVKEFKEEDTFDEIHIIGRGGTSLVCVREYIQEHQPTAAIIFSDLECAPMQPLDIDVPVIWVSIRNTNIPVPFGKIIHIK